MRNNNNAAHFMNPPLERYKNAELQQATEVQKLAYQEFINEGFLEFVDGEVPYCRVSAGGLNLICTKLGLR